MEQFRSNINIAKSNTYNTKYIFSNISKTKIMITKYLYIYI